MVEPETPQPQPLAYEPPAITWEQPLIALTACSPPCPPGEICGGDICIPEGG
jgi:hypothetical protein